MSNSQSHSRNLAPYIPRTILEWYHAAPEGEVHRISRHEGAIICVDASGFTALTRHLSSKGKEGQEILTRVLNFFFEQISQVVLDHGGDVLKFAGDALWAYFPVCPHMGGFFNDILAALQTVNASPFLDGQLRLSVHVGAETGEFFLASLGEPGFRLEAEPVGTLLGTVYRACDVAGENECAVGPVLSRLQSDVHTEIVEDSEFQLVKPGTGTAATDTPFGVEAAGETERQIAIIRSYLPRDVLARIETSAPAMSVQGEHRQVVVLFANFEVNINRKGDDPVEAITGMNDKIRIAFETLRQFHGSVARIDPFKRGHKLLGLFGAPVKREDDEINALLCAGRLIDLCDETFRIRIGLAIGPLFCGDVGASQRREYTVMGDGINLAARLMSKADWKEIIIDPSLRSRLPQEVMTEPVTLALKGIGENVTCHRFTGVSESMVTQDIVATTIGQDSERAILESAWEQTLGGHKQLLAVTGSTGIGKSVLAGAFASVHADAPVIQLAGKNSRLFARGWLTHKLLEKLLEEQSAARNADVAEFVRERIESRWLPLLGDVIKEETQENQWTRGLTPELRVAKLKELFALILKSLVVRPQLVIVDDFEQTDELFRCLVASLADDDLSVPLMLVVIAREMESTAMPLDSFSVFTIVNVQGPTERQWWEYFADNFKDGVRERQLFERILCASRGNPHFIMQFLHQCRSEDKLVLNNISNRWELSSSHLEISVPDGLVNLHLSMFDGLPEIERTIMKAASVAVGEFSAKLLSQGIAELDQSTVEEHLAKLSQAGHLQHNCEKGRYNFTHASMRDSVYQCIPESQLRSLHRRYAEIIEAKESDQHAGLLAYHFYRAGIWRKGFDYSLLAAQSAFKAYALTESADYFGQCLNVLNTAPLDELDTSMVLQFYRVYAEFMVLEGRYSETYVFLRDWRRIGKRVNQPHDCLMAASQTANLLWIQGRYDRCRVVLRRILAYAEQHGDDAARARALGTMCQVERRAGEFTKAQQYGRKAVALAEKTSEAERLAEYRNRLGLAYWGGGKLEEAARIFRELITSEKDDSKRLALALNNLALIEQERGYYLESEKLLSEALEILRTIGDHRHEAYSYGNLGNLCRIFGKLIKAEKLYLQADLIFERLDDRHAHFYSVGNLGDLDLMRGDMASAEHRFDIVTDFAREVDDKELLAECEVRYGELAFFCGRIDEAATRYERAIEIAEKIGTAEYLSRACVGLARLLIGERDHERALKVIERISRLASENNAVLVENEAVFLVGEHHRIKSEFSEAAACYQQALAYASGQNLFELILKSAARLYETDRGSQAQAAKTLSDLQKYFVDNNSLPAWDQLVRSAYFSYFAETLRQLVDSQHLSCLHTV